MTGNQNKQIRGRFDWLGVVTCTAVLAYVQWFLNRDSVEEPRTQNLIKYILVDLACFSVALLIARKTLGASRNRFLRCSLAALLGALISTLIIDLPFFYRDTPNWKGDTAGWFTHAAFILLLNSTIGVLAMTVICGAGYVIETALNFTAASNKRLERTRR